MVKGLHTWQWLNIHAFIVRRMKMFCGLIHFLSVNMNCLCISTVKYPFWNSGKTKVQLYYFCQHANQVCSVFLSCCLDMAMDLFLIAVRTHTWKERGWIVCVCACCVLRFVCGKDIYSRLYFQWGRIAVYVVPSDKIMSMKGFLWTAFILVNSRHQLIST